MTFSAASAFDEIEELNFILTIGKLKVGKNVSYGQPIKIDCKPTVQLPAKAELTLYQGLGAGQTKLSSLFSYLRTSRPSNCISGEGIDNGSASS